ncbi:FAD:protein FMN transferase [Marinobacter zhejiangensis]|uniref:FAD:protein FMN transferase n=1 Tax=Marinobacter zhejiangensis TaxID=488535 RepID=A0A1I4NSQ3_9GAMM|nr:FAD:protein FMN transferase [Marinobacter zhejiangensis]SFM18466.1 thiamine biosynthesis lipoprotein [Marinobacter zhejiangensis]
MTSCMFRPARASAISIIVMLMVATLAGCSFKEEPKIWELSGPIFGTSYHINVVLNDDPQRLENLGQGIEEVLRSVDASMSTWRDDSELSLFNSAEDQSQWHEVSPELLEVLTAADGISRFSEGAFDITVGPVVNLWGFGPEARPEVVPSADELARRLELIGYQNIELQETPPAVRTTSHQYLDLSAIAKGYGVDAVARYLDRAGIGAFLVEIGGEIRVKGRKPNGEAWRLAIEEPVSNDRQVNRVVVLDNHGLATSGDYRNYFEADGQRFSHTIDPLTGKPISHNLASVTVIAENCMLADGIATAFNVMGYEKARALAIRDNIPAYFIVRTGEGFESHYTPAFSSYLVE